MNKKFILTLNCGSSSIKFSIFNIININNKYIYGKVDLINTNRSYIKYTLFNNEERVFYFKYSINYEDSIKYILNNILLIDNIKNNLIGIGHRVVHGGDLFKSSIKINEKIIENIKDLIKFSPIHNPINLIGIYESIKNLPNLKNNNIAVFDTSFHQTIPKHAYLYAIPYDLYKKHKIKRYGAHGISHYYIINKYSEIFNKSIYDLNLITCHLGNGSSISVIKNGKCIDTSMGLTPLEGLIMGTRSGDIDPSIIFYLNKILKISINEIEDILMYKSGFLGLIKYTNDLRLIEKDYFNNNKYAILAIKMYCYRLIKYIGSYFAILNGKLDAIIFTGGIGENSYLIRKLSIDNLSFLKTYIDDEKNNNTIYGKSGIISNNKSEVISIVIPTNEEFIIAKETINLL